MMYQMLNYLLFGLSMAFLFPGAQMATFTIRNNCQFTIWPATLTGANKPQLSKTGFELAPQASDSVDAPPLWEGRIWARTQCSTSAGKFTCGTGDCGSGQVACNGGGGIPPASLAEIFVGAVNEKQSVHDISLVDGFNLPLSITPQGGSGPTCAESKCAANVNSVCPSQLVVPGSDGNTIGCKSACAAFGEPQYCCTGEFEPRDKCQPTNYSKIFSDQCPQAYSYAYKDGTSTFTCEGVPNYLITFCP